MSGIFLGIIGIEKRKVNILPRKVISTAAPTDFLSKFTIAAIKKPLNKATILPIELPGPKLPAKKSAIPDKTTRMTRISIFLGFSLYRNNENRMTQTGAVYCRKIAFAEEVNLLALTKQRRVPA